MATLKAEDIFKRSLELVNTRQFNEAMSFFRNQTLDVGAITYAAEVDFIQDDYETMLSKLTESDSEPDPETEEAYNNLLLQFFELLQDFCVILLGKEKQGAKLIKTFIDKFQEKAGDQSLCELFTAIIFYRKFTESERSSLHQLILNERYPVFMRCTILSAVMIHLFLHFDADMIENIYTYTLDDQPEQIRWQAWVTLFLCAVVHATRIDHCDRLRQQYQFLAESEPDLFISMQLTLLQCKDAEKTHEKLNKLIEKNKNNDEETNKKIFRIFAEGADLSYDAFKMMRHIEFFAHPVCSAHWLMPFSIEQESIKVLMEQNPSVLPVVNLISKSISQSEQDKYASVLMFIGKDIKIADQIDSHMKESGLELDKIMAPSGEILMRNYLHDVYRFYTLSYIGMNQRISPFKEHLDMGHVSWLAPALGSQKALKAIGAYMINNEDWEGATRIYSRLSGIETSEFALQRLAYSASKRQTRNMQLEGDSLIRCNKLFPGNVWTLKHLAEFYRKNNLFTAAEAALQEAIAIEPDNTELLNEQAECYNDMHLYGKALEVYFKLELKNEGDIKIRRQIVRCAFMSQNIETARKYAELILEQRKPINADWAMAGCIALKDQDIKTFLERYSHIGTLRSRMAGFDSNINIMIMGGVPDYLITIARDALVKL